MTEQHIAFAVVSCSLSAAFAGDDQIVVAVAVDIAGRGYRVSGPQRAGNGKTGRAVQVCRGNLGRERAGMAEDDVGLARLVVDVGANHDIVEPVAVEVTGD